MSILYDDIQRIAKRLGPSSPRSSSDVRVGKRVRRMRVVPLRARLPPNYSLGSAYRSRGLAGGETKGMDTANSFNPILATTSTNVGIDCLNLIQTGTGSWNRIGRKTHIKSIRVRGICQHFFAPVAVTGLTESNTIRMLVVWDKAPNGGSIPTFDQMFGTTNQSGLESSTFLDPVKYDAMDRFKILRDKTYSSEPGLFNSNGAGNNTSTNEFEFDEYIKVPLLESVYSGQSVPMTIADVYTGAVYILFRAAQNVTGTNTWSASYFCRLRFKD